MAKEKTFTIETRLDPRISESLGIYFQLLIPFYSMIFRQLWQAVNRSGPEILNIKNKAALNTFMQNRFCISKRMANAIIADVKGRYQAIAELKQYELHQMEYKKETLVNKIDCLKKMINELKPVVAANKADDVMLHKYRRYKSDLYQKQMKLNRLNHKIDKLKKTIDSGRYSVCFGSKKLFKAQFHLKESGFKNKKQWLDTFRRKRDCYAYFLGSSDETAGNSMFQLSSIESLSTDDYKVRNDAYEIKVRTLDKERNYLKGFCTFNYKLFNQYIRDILTNKDKKTALSYRVLWRNNKMYLQVMFSYVPETIPDYTYSTKTNGVIGLDYNDGFIQLAETDKIGNLISLKKYDLHFHGGGNKAFSEIREVSSQIVKYCKEKGKVLVIEKLDFRKKKGKTYTAKGKKGQTYNKMIHQLDYSRYTEVLDNCCYRNHIDLISVNPAYTSKIAEQKYCKPKKLGIHQGAAYVIARRGQGFKDRYIYKKSKHVNGSLKKSA